MLLWYQTWQFRSWGGGGTGRSDWTHTSKQTVSLHVARHGRCSKNVCSARMFPHTMCFIHTRMCTLSLLLEQEHMFSGEVIHFFTSLMWLNESSSLSQHIFCCVLSTFEPFLQYFLEILKQSKQKVVTVFRTELTSRFPMAAPRAPDLMRAELLHLGWAER